MVIRGKFKEKEKMILMSTNAVVQNIRIKWEENRRNRGEGIGLPTAFSLLPLL